MPAPTAANASATTTGGPTAISGRPAAMRTPPTSRGARRPRLSDSHPARGTSAKYASEPGGEHQPDAERRQVEAVGQVERQQRLHQREHGGHRGERPEGDARLGDHRQPPQRGRQARQLAGGVPPRLGHGERRDDGDRRQDRAQGEGGVGAHGVDQRPAHQRADQADAPAGRLGQAHAEAELVDRGDVGDRRQAGRPHQARGEALHQAGQRQRGDAHREGEGQGGRRQEDGGDDHGGPPAGALHEAHAARAP